MSPKDAARFWAKVDKSGDCWLWTAYIYPNGYGQFYYNNRHTLAHRFSSMLEDGPIPKNLDVDHMCHNRACVNPSHLRRATRKQNIENISKLSRRNTSGARGVSWDKKNKKWLVVVKHNQITIHVGRFSSVEEASAAAIAKRNELFTHNDLDRKSS